MYSLLELISGSYIYFRTFPSDDVNISLKMKNSPSTTLTEKSKWIFRYMLFHTFFFSTCDFVIWRPMILHNVFTCLYLNSCITFTCITFEMNIIYGNHVHINDKHMYRSFRYMDHKWGLNLSIQTLRSRQTCQPLSLYTLHAAVTITINNSRTTHAACYKSETKFKLFWKPEHSII